jgi:hypothetical protein
VGLLVSDIKTCYSMTCTSVPNKRLDQLPCGGGSPLAHGISTAVHTAIQVCQQSESHVLVGFSRLFVCVWSGVLVNMTPGLVSSRCLDQLPCGAGSPLAHGISTAVRTAIQVCCKSYFMVCLWGCLWGSRGARVWGYGEYDLGFGVK